MSKIILTAVFPLCFLPLPRSLTSSPSFPLFLLLSNSFVSTDSTTSNLGSEPYDCSISNLVIPNKPTLIPLHDTKAHSHPCTMPPLWTTETARLTISFTLGAQGCFAPQHCQICMHHRTTLQKLLTTTLNTSPRTMSFLCDPKMSRIDNPPHHHYLASIVCLSPLPS